jgi:hypothetical protein
MNAWDEKPCRAKGSEVCVRAGSSPGVRRSRIDPEPPVVTGCFARHNGRRRESAEPNPAASFFAATPCIGDR